MDYTSKVKKILVEEFELEDELIVPSARLREDLDLDSLDGVDLVVALERVFGFRLDDDAIAETETVADIHAHVRHHVEPQQLTAK